MNRPRWHTHERLYPLNIAEQSRLIEHVEERNFYIQYQVYSLLYTGMETGEAAHLTSDMVSDVDAGVNIHLPPKSVECICGGYRDHSTNSSLPGEPCSVDRCDGSYRFNTPRVIPVRDKNAASVISHWFKQYDGGVSQSAYEKRMDELGNRLRIPRLTATVVRLGLAVRLVDQGFERDQIVAIMGYSTECNQRLNRQMKLLGELAGGDNPFICGAPTRSGEPCEKGVKKNGGNCAHHASERVMDTCDVELKDDGRCDNPVSESESRCLQHSDSNNLCGAELVDSSGFCRKLVPDGEDQCMDHRDEQPVCGAETSTERAGEYCSMTVETEDSRCFYHTESE